MPALRYYYSDTISRFLTKNTEEIIGKLTLASQHDINDDTSNSWVEEIETLKQIENVKSISLGSRILRTETVALQVSSIIMYELENGGK